ncbi:putative cGMP-dependent protein kinase [Dunaliella salina]|uniref:cGMP-dependent protein kinase n=1 Tax=Dunaliella salina TaxID=3046 RepID=A0ABQ7GLZ9_DUNSA|nr:putative cGMP-dependent protein kinase [Dunaliella salina]|eukprot:KAF5835635.1 putative cGMP-dependent protein kinase [Dunaliella salina]
MTFNQQLLDRTTSVSTESKHKGVDKSSSLRSPGRNESSPAALGGRPLWGRKRVAVINESAKASEIDLVPKAPHTKSIIADAVRDNLLFQDLPPAALDIIIDSMHPVTVPAGVDIIRQGESPASQFYVLEEGSCDVWARSSSKHKPKLCASYQSGGAFGELALLYSAPRAATVQATSTCQLWVMESAVYHTVKRNFTHESFVARHQLLDSVPALKHLSPHHRALLVDALKQVEFPAGKTIFRKGDPGEEFYLVRKGSAIVVDDNGKVLTRLTPGQYFGELALLGGKARAATVKADSQLLCYSLSRVDFNILLGSRDEIWRFESLQNVPLLSNLSERQLWKLAQAMVTQKCTKGQVVFQKGDPGDAFYIIQDGTFTCFDGQGKELARIGSGSCFGERALLNDSPRAANVMAITDSQVLTLSRKQFNAMLGNLSELKSVWCLETLRKVPLLKGLENATLVKLATVMHQFAVKAGEAVIKQGEAGNCFYIVEHGKLAAYKSLPHGQKDERPSLMYGPGSHFGELALLQNGPRAATVKAVTDASVLALERSDFQELLGPLIPKIAKDAEAYLRDGWKATKREIAMGEVHALAVLGAGGFGQVLLVRYRGQHYALKCIAKDFVIQQGLVAHIKREKDYMLECRSSFLVSLDSTNQDDETLYMLMEAVMGGELFGYLQARGRALSELHARFYAASVILALQYLHDRDLVYRDLKPENLLMDLQGYAKMADFGFVKKVKPGAKTYTLCGTPEYLAPEVIMNKGHNQSADCACSCLTRRYMRCMLCLSLPILLLTVFAAVPTSCTFVCVCVCVCVCAFKSLLDRLLEVSPTFRLGSGRTGADEIKSHQWFEGFDWAAFESHKLPAPYTPKGGKEGCAPMVGCIPLTP